jgi:hypothetical protein
LTDPNPITACRIRGSCQKLPTLPSIHLARSYGSSNSKKLGSTTLTLIKFIEPYSSTKGTLREDVCLRLIKPTTQVYLGNVGLLTRSLRVILLSKHVYNGEGMLNIIQGPEVLNYDKVHWTLFFHKRHLKRRGLLEAYKTHNSSILWQCETLNKHNMIVIK